MFKDRQGAGRELAQALLPTVAKNKKECVVVPLLRGGIIVGHELAAALGAKHLPLAVAKIGAPGQEELAVGAVCFDMTYTDPHIVQSLGLDRKALKAQIKKAYEKFASYAKRFGLTERAFDGIKHKTVIMTDDGIATGATVRAAYLFLKSKRPKRLILAIPVGPTDFDPAGQSPLGGAATFDKVIILHKDPAFAAVSQYYSDFHEVSDEEVKRLMK